jgi:PadR family transcriptional regulator AphA
MELTPTSYIVLGLVELLGEASPYDLKRASAASVANFWSVPHSQLYRESARLKAGGYLNERRESTSGGRTRKVYSLTPSGTEALDTWRQSPAEGLPEMRDPGLLKLFFGADRVPLAAARREAHQRQLEEFESYLPQDDGTPPRGPWQVLNAGIQHERWWIRFWSELAE